MAENFKNRINTCKVILRKLKERKDKDSESQSKEAYNKLWKCTARMRYTGEAGIKTTLALMRRSKYKVLSHFGCHYLKEKNLILNLQ